MTAVVVPKVTKVTCELMSSPIKWNGVILLILSLPILVLDILEGSISSLG